MRRRTWMQPAWGPWALALLVAVPLQALAADPLPSWNDGLVKQAIVGFVTRATTEGGWTVVSMRQDWKRIFPEER
ncbi:hypothetical protein KH5H1_14400 [Corallococcus caeni]|uniref:hypothetical protein n=1 Tax=Corallococcus caeni TaxID=3082388 RepID=UPI002956F80D|nr:hypothetical protein KH5H1_14400 [Corallococcus sp. KH5-1]